MWLGALRLHCLAVAGCVCVYAGLGSSPLPPSQRTTLWSWLSPSHFYGVPRNQTQVSRLAEQALFRRSDLTGLTFPFFSLSIFVFLSLFYSSNMGVDSNLHPQPAAHALSSIYSFIRPCSCPHHPHVDNSRCALLLHFT